MSNECMSLPPVISDLGEWVRPQKEAPMRAVRLLKWPTEEDWLFVKRCAYGTIGKDTDTPPTMAWRRAMLTARHSPIRELHFAFEMVLPYWVAMHLCRHHVGCQPYIQSQRNDRQSRYDRTKAPQDAPVRMIWTMNAEALMTIANKRLCSNASLETREIVWEMCCLVLQHCPEFTGELVPACERDGVCHEMNSCGKVDRHE